MITLSLPYPPTANNLFRNIASGGRAKSSEYAAWLKEAGWQAMLQRPGKIHGPYHLMLKAVRPDNRRRDIGNLEKPVSDLLASLGVIRDDCDAVSIHLMWTSEAPRKADIIVGLSEAA